MKKRRYQISTYQMIQHLAKLKIEKGDVLVCRDFETLEYLSRVKVPGLEGTIPLVFSPQGVQKLTRQDLLNLLEQLDEAQSRPLAPTEQTAAPL